MLTVTGKSIKLREPSLACMASRTYIHCESLKESEAANQLCRLPLPLPHAAWCGQWAVKRNKSNLFAFPHPTSLLDSWGPGCSPGQCTANESRPEPLALTGTHCGCAVTDELLGALCVVISVRALRMRGSGRLHPQWKWLLVQDPGCPLAISAFPLTSTFSWENLSIQTFKI